MPKLVVEVARRALSWRQLVPALLHWRHERRHRRDVRQLDPHTLRDLGLDRSELDSCEAEAMGAVARTRRRIFEAGPR